MKKITPYLVNFAVCACVAVGVIFLRGVLDEESTAGILRCVSDGFFVAGVISLVGGAFTLIGRQGIFDAFVFTFKRIWVSLHDKKYRDKNKQTYAEYRENKKVKTTSYAHLWIIGGAFVAIGIIFTILFYTV